MEKKQKLEIDIEMKDLFWEVLRKWRVVLCCMLVGGILLGTFSYVESYKAANAQPTVIPPAKTAEEVMEELNIDELEKVISAVQLKAQIDAKSQYISESILMQINPFAKDSVIIEYVVDGTDAVRALKSYENWITQGGVVENVDAEDSVYVNELISVVCNESTSVLSIQIVHVDKEECAQLAVQVKDAVAAYTTTLVNNGIFHECRMVSELQSVAVDEELHAYQDEYLKTCIEDQDQLKKMKSDMNGDQVKVYLHLERDVFDRGIDAEETTATSTTVQVSQTVKAFISMKQVVFGMVLGAVLSVVYIFLAYILCGTLRLPGEVEKLYGMGMLGTVREEGKKKSVFAPIDSLIWNLEYRKEKRGSIAEELELAAASIYIQCQKYGYNTVYISGSCISKIAAETLEGLKKVLAVHGLSVEIGENVSENAESLLAAAKAGNVLLVEKKRESAYKNILKCVQTCGTNHIQVLGSVIVEKQA